MGVAFGLKCFAVALLSRLTSHPTQQFCLHFLVLTDGNCIFPENMFCFYKILCPLEFLRSHTLLIVLRTTVKTIANITNTFLFLFHSLNSNCFWNWSCWAELWALSWRKDLNLPWRITLVSQHWFRSGTFCLSC